MARTAITVQTSPGGYDANPQLDLATLQAADFTNGMTLALDGRTRLVVQNPTAGAITITLNGAADPYGRSKSVTAHSIAIAAFLVTAEFPVVGWNSGGGALMNIDFSATGLLLTAIQRAIGQ